MPTIVTIGYQDFILKNDAAAAAILKAFIGAVTMESKYTQGETFYWPSDRQREIKICAVKPGQIVPREPSEPEVTAFKASKQLGGRHMKLIG